MVFRRTRMKRTSKIPPCDKKISSIEHGVVGMIVVDPRCLALLLLLLLLIISFQSTRAIMTNSANDPSLPINPSIHSVRSVVAMDTTQNDAAAAAAGIGTIVEDDVHSSDSWKTLIRRAAGGKDTRRLQTLIGTFGLTASDLDDMAYSIEDGGGKSALHMAAWKGSLANIEFLLQFGCHVNHISRGKYSYGKTAIFFAVTQCREDAVELLLQHGAHVCIVNNKGQSVLSLASSHLSWDMIRRIQLAEKEQEEEQHIKWVNYRLTHSDGAVYGDLDPRFNNNALSDHDENKNTADVIAVKTDLALHPTTPQSRKGAFARRNPELVHQEKKRHQMQKQQLMLQKRERKTQPFSSDDNNNNTHPANQQLSPEQQNIWDRLKSSNDKEISDIAPLLISLVRIYMTERRSWIQEVAAQLDIIVSADTSAVTFEHIKSTADQGACTERERILLQKIARHVANRHRPADSVSREELDSMADRHGQGKSYHKLPSDLRKRLWQDVCLAVNGLTTDMLQNPTRNSQHLSLPNPPTWVDTPHQLQILQERLHELDKSSRCIAFDTEWSHSPDGDSQVATLQLAIHDQGLLPTWVLDLQSTELRPYAVEFLQWLFYESGIHLLGFAVGRDLRKLEEYMSLYGNDQRNQRIQNVVIDLQLLSAEKMGNTNQHPGLKACCQRFVSSTYSLSKEEQCSDWARRPLTSSQMEYAGLDAAVLLILLAQLVDCTSREKLQP